MTKTLSLAGWTYEVVVGADGKILTVACKQRFPATDPKYIGDEWLVTKLQEMCDAD